MAMLTFNGIDVSHWQGVVDWGKVKASGIDFAFVKAANCWKNGSITPDEKFTANVKGALAAGLKVGVYAYMYTRTVDAARTAARNVVALLATSKGLIALPVACDMEEAAIAKTGRATCTAMAAAWRDEIAKAGFAPALYCNPTWLKNYITRPDNMALWLAHYTTKPYCASEYWQHSATGRVPGISGNVDLDYGYAEPDKPSADGVVVKAPGGTAIKKEPSDGKVSSAVRSQHDPEADIAYLAAAGIMDSPDLWREIVAGERTASVKGHIIPLLSKFRAAVEDEDHILDELQDIISNHDD